MENFKFYKQKDKLDFWKKYPLFLTDITIGGCCYEIYNWLEEETEFVVENISRAQEFVDELNEINQKKNFYEEEAWVIRRITDKRFEELVAIVDQYSEEIQERLYRDRKVKNYKVAR